MIKRARRPDNHFMLIRNDVARDENLSYRASGLLTAILSRPDNWTASAEQLASERKNGEGVKAVRRALAELERYGYLKRERVRGDNGRFSWVQTIYDLPNSDVTVGGVDVSAGQTISPKPPDGFPPDGFGPSKEEPKRTTEEEDVTELDCSASARFAHVDDDDSKRSRSGDDQPPHTNITEDAEGRNFSDWRAEDRIAFKAVVGERLRSLGLPGCWKPGVFTADAFYKAFRTQQPKPIKWPGRFVNDLYARGAEAAIEDWLTDQGLEIVK